jgi:hypothetical protein
MAVQIQVSGSIAEDFFLGGHSHLAGDASACLPRMRLTVLAGAK